MHINRNAVVLKAKQPFVDWINTTPREPGDELPRFTLEQFNQECMVLLIPEFDSIQEAREQVRQLKMDLFEESLEDWYTDEEDWPQNRTEKMFDEWFSLEIHSEVIDTVDGPIEKEDLGNESFPALE